MPAVEHTADRPSWDCRVCGRPWPCAPARLSLRTEMGDTELRVYSWTMLEDAVGELPQLAGPELFKRFVVWARA